MGFGAAIIAAIVAALVAVWIWYFVDVTSRKGSSERTITHLCDPRGGGVFFDVQGENKMVYACNDDGKLRVRAY